MRNQGQAAELKSVNMPRNRLIYAGFSALTLVCGLATRPLHSVIGPELAENLGDALWAMLVYLLIAWTWRRQSSGRIAMATLAVSVAVEFSQMYHAPWLDAIRRTTLGGLVLGWGFAWGDLIAYASGIAACFILERCFRRKLVEKP
jgi:hypothetical protein